MRKNKVAYTKKGPKTKTNKRHKKTQDNKKVSYFRNFGSLSDDSVVTDIYNKKFKNKQETIAKKCIVRKMTEEEYEKYFPRKKYSGIGEKTC